MIIIGIFNVWFMIIAQIKEKQKLKCSLYCKQTGNTIKNPGNLFNMKAIQLHGRYSLSA